MSTKEFIDLTDAWLDWKEQCAAERCTPENKMKLYEVAERIFIDDVKSKIYNNQLWMQDITNVGKSKGDSEGKRAFVDSDESKGDSVGKRAFNFVESYLYMQDKIKGMPFKDYLFSREKQNLTGYVLGSVMVHQMRRIDKGENKYKEHIKEFENSNEAGMAVNPAEINYISDERKQQIIRMVDSWTNDVKLMFLQSKYRQEKQQKRVRELENCFDEQKSARYVKFEKAKTQLNTTFHDDDELKIYKVALDELLAWEARNYPHVY